MSNTTEHGQLLKAGQEPSSNLVGEELAIDSCASSSYALDNHAVDSSTTSLSSSVMAFRMEYGRRYHAFDDDAYWLPNDEEEMSRLDLQHIVWSLCLNGRLCIAPLPTEMERVLDLGTGTGKWAIEFADKHPTVQVIGTDLSPIQPTCVPPNCSFVVDNIEDEWIFREPFDYIHSRTILLGVFSSLLRKAGTEQSGV
jgi:SAM-dependent methyltransferase